MKQHLKSFIALIATLTMGMPAEARIDLPSVFTDNMVVQQRSTMVIRGTATPRAQVTLKAGWSKKTLQTTADAQGKWTLELATPKAGGPYTLTFSDGEELTLSNVLVGEVWLGSGQSNMEMPVAGWGRVMNYEQEIRDANYPSIRLFQVKKTVAQSPQDRLETDFGGWKECTPENIPEFSSLCYFYARELWNKLHVPVGVINTSWGGTPAESWVSAESLGKVMGYQEHYRLMKQAGFSAETANKIYQEEQDSWQQALDDADPGSKEGYQLADYNDAAWGTHTLPGYFENQGLPSFDGTVWYRRTVDIPQDWAGKDLELNFCAIDDEDVTYWNGELVHHGYGYTSPRHYTVPGKLVKVGKNVVVVRVIDGGNEGGFHGEAKDMNVRCGSKEIALAGTWKWHKGCDKSSLPPTPIHPTSSAYPSGLYNAMIHPLLDFPIAGVIWYQGCANVGRDIQYESLFQTLIQDWRIQFGNPKLPFYFVQLANYLAPNDLQPLSEWAFLRESQAKALCLDNVSMMTNIDLGEAGDIHPKNKQEVARRLALIALHHNYGKKVAWDAPQYKSYTIDGEKAYIHLTQPDCGEKIADADNLPGFMLAGPDHIFHRAQASIKGGVITVTCPGVIPVAVRYGWADNPTCTLQTPSGLHVAPFRTDDWAEGRK